MKAKLFFIFISGFLATQCSCQKNKSISQNTPNQSNTNTVFTMPKTSSAEVNSTYPTENTQEDIIRLKEKQNLFSKKQETNITFLSVKQDSRCPMNARCMVAGNATVEIELMSVHSRPKTFLLSTEDTKDAKKTIMFNGNNYTLEAIYPATHTELSPEKMKGNYVIDLKIEPVIMNRVIEPELTTK